MEVGVVEPSIRIERLVRLADSELDVDHLGADRGEDLAKVGLRPDSAEQAGACADYKKDAIADALARLVETIREDLASEAAGSEEATPAAAQAGLR